MSKSRTSTGQYSFEGRWYRGCECGHVLGHHTAAAPHSCIEVDFSKSSCTCEAFKEVRGKEDPALIVDPTYRNDGRTIFCSKCYVSILNWKGAIAQHEKQNNYRHEVKR